MTHSAVGIKAASPMNYYVLPDSTEGELWQPPPLSGLGFRAMPLDGKGLWYKLIKCNTGVTVNT